MAEKTSEISLGDFSRDRILRAVESNLCQNLGSPELMIALAAMDVKHVDTLLEAISTFSGLNEGRAREVASIVEAVEEMLP